MSILGPVGSLRRSVVLNIIAALSLCILLAGAVMIHEFYEHLEENLEEMLFEEAKEIIGQVDPNAPAFGLNVKALRYRGIEGMYRYTVFDGTGSVVAGGESSDAIWAQLKKTELGHPKIIKLPGDRIGLGLRARSSEKDIIVLVSTYPTGNENTQFEKLTHEIEEQIVWVILGVLIVLTSAIYATRRGLAPLDPLSDQAAQIGPKDSHQRLATKQVPAEITPLIDAVNGAFDRMEAGYQAQRDFSSNVAHEIRTPIAVLRSSVERISDPELRESLIQDVTQLDQIFQQLIDLARADAASKSSLVPVDLHDLAVGIASEMAQTALQGGQTLSVIGPKTVIVQGNAGLLGIALRNVIQNALQHALEGTDVEIQLMNAPPGWQVTDSGPGVPDERKSALFERFNRGQHTNTGSKGSGIGLAIVKSVADLHDAKVSIRDADQNGSIFSFQFNI